MKPPISKKTLIALLQHQLSLERALTKIAASTGRPSIIIFDRGCMDAKGYMSQEVWERVLPTGHTGDVLFLEDDFEVSPSTAGFVASYYYIDYRSVLVVREQLLDAANELSLPSIVQVLANTHEFAELPVRHNEEELNYELSQALPWPVDMGALGSPHTKACLLLLSLKHISEPTRPY